MRVPMGNPGDGGAPVMDEKDRIVGMLVSGKEKGNSHILRIGPLLKNLGLILKE